MAFLHGTGLHGDVIVRSDQKPVVVGIIEQVPKIQPMRGGRRFVVEKSSAGTSQFTGVAERVIQSVQNQVRGLKLALKKRLGFEMPRRHSASPWLVEYDAAFLLNWYEVGHDGKAAHEPLKGKRAKILRIEFGEGVHRGMKLAEGALGKLDSLWNDGVFFSTMMIFF